MSDRLLSEWEDSTTRYGYRTRDTPSPLLLAGLTADLAELRLVIVRHRSASALPRIVAGRPGRRPVRHRPLPGRHDRHSPLPPQRRVGTSAARARHGSRYRRPSPTALEAGMNRLQKAMRQPHRAAMTEWSRPSAGFICVAHL
jgi:hypothetical protein